MVDIVLSSYNGEKYIAEQIESILECEVQDFRLFVFDDASYDSTADIVKRFEDEYPEKVFMVRSSVNRGSTCNFIQGLKFAARTAPADYYMFCDQDDVWLENRITVCLTNIIRLEEEYSPYMPLMLFTDAVLVDEELNSLGTTFFKADRLNTGKLDFARILTENRCIGCTSFMNAALVKMISGYDRRIRYHDWWAALVASAFGKIEFINEPTVLYRQHQENVVGQKNFTGYIKDRIDEIGGNCKIGDNARIGVNGKKNRNRLISGNGKTNRNCQTKSAENGIRRRLRKTIAQASAFHKIYGSELSPSKKRILREFIALGSATPIERRRLIIKNGFYKSGLFRNLGLFLFV